MDCLCGLSLWTVFVDCLCGLSLWTVFVDWFCGYYRVHGVYYVLALMYQGSGEREQRQTKQINVIIPTSRTWLYAWL